MAKLIMGMIVFQLIASIIASFLQGGGGYVAQPLEANLSSTGTAIYVMSTAEYLAPSVVTIDDEQIEISAIGSAIELVVGQRGYGRTIAVAHYQLNSSNQETMVYSEGAALNNNTMQVRIVKLQNSLDNGNVLSIGGSIVGLVATFLTSPLSFLNSDLWMFTALYLAVAAALIIILAIAILGSIHIF